MSRRERERALTEVRLANFKKINVANEMQKLRRIRTEVGLILSSIDAALDNMARLGKPSLSHQEEASCSPNSELNSTS